MVNLFQDKTRISIIYISLLTIFLVVSCNEESKRIENHTSTGKLVSLDHTDTNLCCGRPYDTTLQSGWSIQYLVKDDSTKYRDVYIKWMKDGKSGLYYGQYLLSFRTYFVPELAGENDRYIFMAHGCATSCAGLLVFSKDKLIERDFSHIKAYNIAANKVVWLPDDDFANVEGGFKVTISDLTNSKDTTLAFSNLALGSYQEGYIDTVIFSKGLTKIKCTLLDKNDDTRQRQIVETKAVKQ